jgi:hypothetical protein
MQTLEQQVEELGARNGPVSLEEVKSLRDALCTRGEPIKLAPIETLRTVARRGAMRIKVAHQFPMIEIETRGEADARRQHWESTASYFEEVMQRTCDADTKAQIDAMAEQLERLEEVRLGLDFRLSTHGPDWGRSALVFFVVLAGLIAWVFTETSKGFGLIILVGSLTALLFVLFGLKSPAVEGGIAIGIDRTGRLLGLAGLQRVANGLMRSALGMR